MSNNIAIEFEHVSKQYRLGLVSTKTLSHDIRRFWITNVLGKEDPYLKIGETNYKNLFGSYFFYTLLESPTICSHLNRSHPATSANKKNNPV